MLSNTPALEEEGYGEIVHEVPIPFDTSDYTHVDDSLPTEAGSYDCIWHTGSISTSYKEAPARFKINAGRPNTFSRYDWDYVIMWKPRNEPIT